MVDGGCAIGVNGGSFQGERYSMCTLFMGVKGAVMRILVADDDQTIRLWLEHILFGWGYAVETVSDGLAALASLQSAAPPKLALLDWTMPGLEGIEVCRRIRAIPTDEPAHLIILTAHTETKNVVIGLEAGANDYISKPFNMEELRARLAVGRRVIELQQALAQRVRDLQEALTHIKTLQGILPICMHCHKIRNDQQSWERLERYFSDHAEVRFSHGICPDCATKLYPDIADQIYPPETKPPVSGTTTG